MSVNFWRCLFLTFLLTEKVLAKNGLPCKHFQRKTELEQKFFPLAKLLKKWKRKNFLRILLTEFSKTVFTPFFANTLLCAVSLFFNFSFIKNIICVNRFYSTIFNISCNLSTVISRMVYNME